MLALENMFFHEEQQQRLNRIQENLKDYLSQVSNENLSGEDVEWKFVLLDYSQGLTATGTLIVREPCDPAVRHIQSNIEPLPRKVILAARIGVTGLPRFSFLSDERL
jgi:hypothetical protein